MWLHKIRYKKDAVFIDCAAKQSRKEGATKDDDIEKKRSRIETVMEKWSLLDAITPWEVGAIPIAPQLHMDLVVDTGNSRWSTTWLTMWWLEYFY